MKTVLILPIWNRKVNNGNRCSDLRKETESINIIDYARIEIEIIDHRKTTWIDFMKLEFRVQNNTNHNMCVKIAAFLLNV